MPESLFPQLFGLIQFKPQFNNYVISIIIKKPSEINLKAFIFLWELLGSNQ